MVHQNKKCPNCGKDMLEGYMLAGYNHHLQWFAKGYHPSTWEQLRFTSRKESTETMMTLSQARMDCERLPALNCADCKLVLLDYGESDITGKG